MPSNGGEAPKLFSASIFMIHDYQVAAFVGATGPDKEDYFIVVADESGAEIQSRLPRTGERLSVDDPGHVHEVAVAYWYVYNKLQIINVRNHVLMIFLYVL